MTRSPANHQRALRVVGRGPGGGGGGTSLSDIARGPVEITVLGDCRGAPAVQTPNSFAKRSASDILSSPASVFKPIAVSLDEVGTTDTGVSIGVGGGGGGGGNGGGTGGAGIHDSCRIIFFTSSKSGGNPRGGIGRPTSKVRKSGFSKEVASIVGMNDRVGR